MFRLLPGICDIVPLQRQEGKMPTLKERPAFPTGRGGRQAAPTEKEERHRSEDRPLQKRESGQGKPRPYSLGGALLGG